jgi:enoyl-CoA hydratase/carnithine racemase
MITKRLSYLPGLAHFCRNLKSPDSNSTTMRAAQESLRSVHLFVRELDGLHYDVDAERKIGWLTLDRPPLNIISYRGRSQIAAILEAFGPDPGVRVVIIRGGVFSSGGDVKAFPNIEGDGMSHMARNIAAPERCPKPVICAFELAMSCDIRIATADTVLALPEVSLGQIPGSGGSQRVARIAGVTRAVDMMMLGRRIPAPEAHGWGLLTRVADDAAGLGRMIHDGAAAHLPIRTGAQDHQARAQRYLRLEPFGRP